MKRLKLWMSGLAALLLLSACGSEIDTPGEELRVLAGQLEPAYLGEPYSDDIPVVGGLAPYAYEVSEGALPAGLSLQGNTIRGTPTEPGTARFTVTVSDANLSKTFREFTIEVTEPPPAELSLNVPETEMRGPFFLRGEVRNARGLQALRSSISWDPRRFELVPGSVRTTRNGLVLFQQAAEGSLNVDLAVLSGSLSGEHDVFEFQLRPVAEPSTILVTARTEFLSADGDHGFAVLKGGTQPAETQPDDSPVGEDGEEAGPGDPAEDDPADGAGNGDDNQDGSEDDNGDEEGANQ